MIALEAMKEAAVDIERDLEDLWNHIGINSEDIEKHHNWSE